MTGTIGEHLVRLLALRDVNTVFGIPGAHTIELYRGLASSCSVLSHTLHQRTGDHDH